MEIDALLCFAQVTCKKFELSQNETLDSSLKAPTTKIQCSHQSCIGFSTSLK